MIAGLRWFGPRYVMPDEEIRVQRATFGGLGVAPSWGGPLVVIAVGNTARLEHLHLDFTAENADQLRKSLETALEVIREWKENAKPKATT